MRRIALAALLSLAWAAAFAQSGQFPAHTTWGNPSALQGQAKAMTTTELTTLCNSFTSLLPGCVPASGGGAVNSLRADGTWMPPDTVSVKDFGAKCDNSTLDTTAIQSALNSGNSNISVPGICLTASLTIPTTVKLISGGGTIKASGSISAFGSVLLATNCTGLTIRDLMIDVNKTTYSTVNSIAFVTGTNCKVQNVNFINAGRFGVYIGGGTGIVVEDSTIQNFAQSSIWFSNLEGTITNPVVQRNYLIGNATQTGNVVDGLVPATDAQIIDNYIVGGANNGWGIGAQGWTRGLIARNIIKNTFAEGIAAYGVQTKVVDNFLYWDAGVSRDFGMSSVAAGDGMTISGNTIIQSGKTGIAIGSTAVGYTIENNKIIDANQLADATNGNGIELSQTANSHVVRNNYMRNQNTARMIYCIREFNSASANRYEGNYCYAPTTGDYIGLAVNSKIVWKYDLSSGTPTGDITFLGVSATSLALTNPLTGANGGTGVANTGKTITIGGNLTTAGAASLPVIAQGDLWYGSAAATISALAKSTTSTRYLANTGTSNNPQWDQVNLTNGVTGVLPVANGGTNCSSASISCFNNITGLSASGTTGTTSTNLVFSASPTLSGTVAGAISFSGSTINFTGNTSATGPTTGTIVVTGGVGITGALYTTGNQVVTNGTQSNVYVRASGNASGFIMGRSILAGNAQDWFLFDEVASLQRLGVDSVGNFKVFINTASTSTTTGSGIFTGGVGVAGAIYGGAEVTTGTTTVASLPTCNAAHKASRHFVTDANATFTAGIGAVVAAGGANNVPVTCDGTNWRIGANDNFPIRSRAA